MDFRSWEPARDAGVGGALTPVTARPIIPSLDRGDLMASPSLAGLQTKFGNYLTGVRGYAETTRRNYDKSIDQFRAFLSGAGRMDTVAEFTDDAILGWITDLAARGVKASSIVVKLSALSSFAAYLMKCKTERGKVILAANPTKQIDWPTVEQADTEYMRREEVDAFLSLALPLNEQVVRAVLFDTGLRRAELCRANLGDLVETDGWCLAVTVKGRGTRRRKIHMPLDASTMALITDFLMARGYASVRDAPPEQPLLLTRRGTRYTGSTLQYLITSIGEQAGFGRMKLSDEEGRIRLSPHKVRHTVNVVRDLGGVDEFRRARLLGQSNARSQERYRHIVQGGLREAKTQQADGLARYLGHKALTVGTNDIPSEDTPANP